MDDWWLDTLNALMAAQSGRKYNIHFEPTTTSQQATNLRTNIKWNSQYYLGTCDGGQPGQVIKVDRIVAICQQPIPPGPVILINPLGEGTSNPSVPWMAYAPRINQESSTRVVQNSRRGRKDRDQLEPGYAIFYSVSKETVVEYWVATDTYEVQVFSLDKVRQVTTPLPPGKYLAIWGDIHYPYEGEIFSNNTRIETIGDFYSRILIPDPSLLYFAYDSADSFFGFLLGIIKHIKMPTPLGLKPRFTGEFITGATSDFFNSVYSNQPLIWDYAQNSFQQVSFNPPLDMIQRGTYKVDFNFPAAFSSRTTGNFTRVNQTLWEFTSERVIDGPDYFQFTWQPGPNITSKGLTKDDLLYINTRIYAPANINVPPGVSHYTVGLIDYSQTDPGSAYLTNRLSFDEGSGAVKVQSFFPGEQTSDIVPFTSQLGHPLSYRRSPVSPPLLFNGRNMAGPNQPQVFYAAQSAESYLSSVGKSAVFFIKYENKTEELINNIRDNNFNYQNKEYKIIQSDGNVDSFGDPSIVDISVDSQPIDTTIDSANRNLAQLNLLRYGFKEWKAYLTGMNRTFENLLSPIGDTQPSQNIPGNQLSGLNFNSNFFGRHKVAAANIINRGIHVDEEYYLTAPFSEIVNFLEDEDNDAESTASFTFENIRYIIGTLDPPPQTWPSGRWVNHIVSEDEPVEYTVDIIKPVELAKFLADDSGDIEGVTIIDIIPLVEE